jgi:hypothetical protein
MSSTSDRTASIGRLHSPIGLHHVEFEATLNQTVCQLSCARTDLGNVRSAQRDKPVDSDVGVRRTPVVVLIGPGSEGGCACAVHDGDHGSRRFGRLQPHGYAADGVQ